MYIFETGQLLEQLEQIILTSETSRCFDVTAVNEIFRIMHTIKGSSAMMLVDQVCSIAHLMEDVFFYIRENKVTVLDCNTLTDIMLESLDFIKAELEKLKTGQTADGNAEELNAKIKSFLAKVEQDNPAVSSLKKPAPKQQQYYIMPNRATVEEKQCYQAVIHFTEGCEMENVRAFTLVHSLQDIVGDISYSPQDILDDDDTAVFIQENGFTVSFSSEKPYEELHEFLLENAIFLKELNLTKIEGLGSNDSSSGVEGISNIPKIPNIQSKDENKSEEVGVQGTNQNIISVSVAKLDRLMDLVGELVISESMVTQNPDLAGMNIDNFKKAARQLRKITGELQDTVMSIRMVPLSLTFHKMHRIVRDMRKKLGKEVELEIIGEATEVDKNVIENISDPIMHLLRNAIDHGIELPEERINSGKPSQGKVTLEALSAGSEVLVIIRDNGRGLDKEKILKRAKEKNLLMRPENELSDKEIYSYILYPGFSTKESVTEFSGRGVGMDVVTKNINAIGGTVIIDSILGSGTTITLKIPLTLAIVAGMTIGVGSARYTIPITSIRESFRPQAKDIICDLNGNEMLMVRGQCYPIVRLHEFYKVKTTVNDLSDGIIVIVETEKRTLCLFADELIGEHQVVVKALPVFIKRIRPIPGIAGCTLLGDGGISLILDAAGIAV
ncbi:MAG: CheA signal transduction histidine kinase [Firmicutes bacterium]|nr:CheA signal transduction histidine kinase [Bacillota bacterium]